MLSSHLGEYFEPICAHVLKCSAYVLKRPARVFKWFAHVFKCSGACFQVLRSMFSHNLEGRAPSWPLGGPRSVVATWRATLGRGRARCTDGLDRSASLQHRRLIAANGRVAPLCFIATAVWLPIGKREAALTGIIRDGQTARQVVLANRTRHTTCFRTAASAAGPTCGRQAESWRCTFALPPGVALAARC